MVQRASLPSLSTAEERIIRTQTKIVQVMCSDFGPNLSPIVYQKADDLSIYGLMLKYSSVTVLHIK